MGISNKNTALFIGLTIIFLASCARETYNISYNGVIVDEHNNYPIAHSSVQSFCLYQQNIDQSATHTVNTTTDSLGNFQLNFDKGYKLTLIIAANDYVETFLQFKPSVNHLPDTIYLKRKELLQSSTLKTKTNSP
ncbi:hypothetical protein E9993_10160 [Labilibacter sediminis]|nr:hypothetical protein E9993_10160 [Labilibacter sediminis]